MSLIQIDGLSGSGKTTLVKELVDRGYNAVDSDEMFAYFGDPKTGHPTNKQIRVNWIWDLAKIRSFADTSAQKSVFICGGALNQDNVKELFKKRFMLVIDDETMKQRLASRVNNDFGKHPDELTELLKANKATVAYAKSINATVIDATKPVKDVAEEILTATNSTITG